VPENEGRACCGRPCQGDTGEADPVCTSRSVRPCCLPPPGDPCTRSVTLLSLDREDRVHV
jgi:hypothetical protein